MPGLLSSIQRFDLSTGIPKAVWTTLLANAVRANLILPHAEKVFGRQKFTPKISSTEQLWLVYSKPGTSEIQFILACTEGPLDKYPLFILPIATLAPKLLKSAMEALCSALLNEPGFKRERVFSVFSDKIVTEAFALAWEKLAEISRLKDPYYDAFLSVCTKSTLCPQQRAAVTSEDLEPRRAVEKDTNQIAVLCKQFAATSAPFFLSEEKALEEARLLIANKQLWVLEMREHNGKPEIATIVAVTRKSEGIATITKVYTPSKWRGKGCAKTLVRHVCVELLEKYEQIVLYVGVENPAKAVYSHVGFQGLSEGSLSSERWLEIGFDNSKVKLGHW
ncbi:hypothetical protein EDD22DRAFT_417897 [Suillus occidentalis]|nr:hypothetical protein EDD22DRAFT_417897 [Suillus occidentalis]